ncbi:unnamed protein product, partial [Owenia fusiformis]
RKQKVIMEDVTRFGIKTILIFILICGYLLGLLLFCIQMVTSLSEAQRLEAIDAVVAHHDHLSIGGIALCPFCLIASSYLRLGNILTTLTKIDFSTDVVHIFNWRLSDNRDVAFLTFDQFRDNVFAPIKPYWQVLSIGVLTLAYFYIGYNCLFKHMMDETEFTGYGDNECMSTKPIVSFDGVTTNTKRRLAMEELTIELLKGNIPFCSHSSNLNDITIDNVFLGCLDMALDLRKHQT